MAQPGHRIIQSKLVLLGDMGTGKTSLVLRFVKDQFFTHLEPTIGAAFFTQGLSLTDATVKLDIWDTAGQERYHSLVPMYYRGAESAIVVYDISSLDTFDRAKKWVQELQNQSHSQGNPNLVMALVANKSDLEPKKEVDDRVHTLKRLHSLPVYCPDHTDGENFAEENGMLFMRTSAKTAENVNELFYEIAKRLATLHPPKPHGTDLNEARPGGIRKMFCCSG